LRIHFIVVASSFNLHPLVIVVAIIAAFGIVVVLVSKEAL
jgi:hypothetical protein